MRVYTSIRLPSLFHTSTISSKSLSVSFLGDSMMLDRLSSVKQLRWCFCNSFMYGKLHSADVVEMGIAKNMVASL